MRPSRARIQAVTGGPPGGAGPAVFRGALACVAAWLLYRPLHHAWVALLAAGAQRLLPFVWPSGVISSLGAHDGTIVIRSHLTGADLPMTVWSAWSLPFHLAMAQAIVQAPPGRDLRRRVRLGAAALVLFAAFSLAISIVQVPGAAAAHAASQFGIAVHSAFEQGMIGALGWALPLAALAIAVALPGPRAWREVREGRGAGGGDAAPVARPAGFPRRRAAFAALGMATAVAALAGWWLFAASAGAAPSERSRRAAWERVLRLNPGFAPALVNVGAERESAGRIEEAVGLYRRALTADPERVAAHYNLGRALVKQGLHEEAARAFEEVLRRQPDNAAARKNLAVALLQNDRPCEALAQLRQAAQDDVTLQADPRVREQVRRLEPLCPAGGP